MEDPLSRGKEKKRSERSIGKSECVSRESPFFLHPSASFDFAQVETLAAVQPRIIPPSLRCSRLSPRRARKRCASSLTLSSHCADNSHSGTHTENSIPPEQRAPTRRRAASCRSRSECGGRRRPCERGRPPNCASTHARTRNAS